MQDLKEVKIKGFPKPFYVDEDGKKIVYEGKLLGIKLLKPKRHKNGYHVVYLKNEMLYVHRIIAEAYLVNPKPVAFKWVYHKNGNTLDNHFSNLSWGNREVVIENQKKFLDHQ